MRITHWGRVLASIVATLTFGCGNSLEQDLLLSQQQYQILNEKSARRLIPQKFDAIGVELDHAANKLISGNERKAKEHIRQANLLLENSRTEIEILEKKARKESEKLLAHVADAIEHIWLIVPQLPAKTYSEQNRIDIIRFRIWALQELLKEIQQFSRDENYFGIQRKAPEIRRSVKDILAYIGKHSELTSLQTQAVQF